jgi:hypothetical protein
MRYVLGFLATIILAIAPAAAGSLDVGINTDSAQARVGFDAHEETGYRVNLGLGFLYNDGLDAQIGSASALFVVEPESIPGFEIGLGICLYAGSSGEESVGSFPIGIQADWAPAALKGFFFGARVFYGPAILSWSDTESLLEAEAQVGYRFAKPLGIFLQFRNVRVDVGDRDDRDIDNDVRVGFNARF